MKMDNWQLKKEKDGIEVYVNENSALKFNETKSTVTIKNSIDKTVDALMDVPGRATWSENVKKGNANILGKEGDVIIGQLILSMPWPLKDREMIARYKTEFKDNGNVIVTLKGAADYIPRKKKLVRLENVDITWIIKPINDKMIHLTYKTIMDPGGQIPEAIVKLIAVEGPYKALSGLKNYLEKK